VLQQQQQQPFTFQQSPPIAQQQQQHPAYQQPQGNGETSKEVIKKNSYFQLRRTDHSEPMI